VGICDRQFFVRISVFTCTVYDVPQKNVDWTCLQNFWNGNILYSRMVLNVNWGANSLRR